VGISRTRFHALGAYEIISPGFTPTSEVTQMVDGERPFRCAEAMITLAGIVYWPSCSNLLEGTADWSMRAAPGYKPISEAMKTLQMVTG